MLYKEIKKRLKELPNEPIPLSFGGHYTEDIRQSINVHVRQIKSKTPEQLRKKGIHQASKAMLIKILKAIEEGKEYKPKVKDSFSNY